MNTKRISADKLISLLMPKESEMDPVGFWALQNMRRISKLNGNSNMTLDEINAEIDAYRKESASCH